MIVITGAAGFIGSVLAARLNEAGYKQLVLVDDFSREDKKANWQAKQYEALVPRTELLDWLVDRADHIEFVVHLGARTDTTDKNTQVFQELNLDYSQKLWDWCVENQVPLIYASSAATYGDGSLGFEDMPPNAHQLQPLNPYAWSKNEFDKRVLDSSQKPFFWAGLKFFNVYGPNEYHKGRMASVPFHAVNQIREHGGLKLFQSHRPDCAHGAQQRDFIYVKDVADVIVWLMQKRPQSGLINLGTGQARTFNDLGTAVFSALNLPPNISYTPMPEDIRDSYQYYTQANMQQLVTWGYPNAFTTIEDGIADYVRNYLAQGVHY